MFKYEVGEKVFVKPLSELTKHFAFGANGESAEIPYYWISTMNAAAGRELEISGRGDYGLGPYYTFCEFGHLKFAECVLEDVTTEENMDIDMEFSQLFM